MRIGFIGVGQAGGKIVDRFLEYDQNTGSNIVGGAIAVNTAEADLLGLSKVPEGNRLLLGQSRVKGHGVGADNELGTEIMEEDVAEVMDAVADFPMHELDAFIVVAGLGGGTGSGGAPVVTRELQRIYTEPVYGLGVLPGRDEGSIYTLNAARSFQTFVREADAMLTFDNDVFHDSAYSSEEAYRELNNKLVYRFGPLFNAGEVDPEDAVAESVVDASELINTFAAGGVVSVGHASTEVDVSSGGLLSRFRSSDPEIDDAEAVTQVSGQIRKATLGELTLPCEVESTARALVLVSGPPSRLNRKGVEEGRQFVEEQTGSMEVRGGDFPLPKSDHLAATVVLAGVTDVPRVKELQQVAVEAKQNKAEILENHEQELDHLVDGGDGEDVEPLF